MTVLVDLVRDLSWSLKAAWIAWTTWVAIQVMWHRRARIEVSQHEASPRDWLPERSTLGLAPRPERMRASAALPAPALSLSPPSIPELPLSRAAAVSAVDDAVEPLAMPLAGPAEAPTRPKRSRRSPQPEMASTMSAGGL